MKEKVIKPKSEKRARPGRISRMRDFFKGVWLELTKKVKWPTRHEMVQYTIIVILFVAFWAAYVGLWDFIFAKGVEFIIK